MSVALYVPLMLLAIAVVLMAGSHFMRQLRERRQAAAAAEEPDPKILIHSINDDRCTGCDACVAVCPTDVLELVANKSRVLRFGDCIQCEQCMLACPTQALVMHWDDEEPPPLKVPHLDPYYQTGVPGMYLIGEVAGKPLVKNAANIGRAVIEHMVREGLRAGGGKKKRAEGSDAKNITTVDVAIVGSGPGGLSAALTCLHHGLSYVLLEKEQLIASTVARYPKGKDVMAEPYDVRNVSFLPVYDATKEELLPEWHKLIELCGVGVRMGEAVESVTPEGDGAGFAVRTTVAGYRVQQVVLATGTRGKPRTLGVPGENLPKVANLLDDPDLYRGKDVLVIGGGDSAVEAACALADSGARVTLSYRGKQFNRAQAKNRERLTKYAKDRKVTVLLGSTVSALTEREVGMNLVDGQTSQLPNAATFVLIGADPPVAWLEKLGVEFVERPHWYALGATDQLVESLIGRIAESPREIAALAARVRGQARPMSAAEVLPPVPEASVMRPLPIKPTERPRTLPGSLALDWSEDAVFTSATKLGADPGAAAPMSLEEFARKSKEKRAGGGGRKKVRTSEETRILRALRDEGARLAHDETGVSVVSLNSRDVQIAASGGGPSTVELSNVSVIESADPFEQGALTQARPRGAPLPVPPPRAPARRSAPPPQDFGPPPPVPLPAPVAAAPPPPSRAPARKSQPPPDFGPPPPAPSPSLARLPPPSRKGSFETDESTLFVDSMERPHGGPPPSVPPPTRAIVEGLPPPSQKKPGFIEARTTAASPEFLAEMRAVSATAPPRDDNTQETAQSAPPDFEVVSRDPEEEDGWEVDDSTALAEPGVVERLRDELRRK